MEKFLLKNHQSFIIKKEKINNLLSPNSAVITKSARDWEAVGKILSCLFLLCVTASAVRLPAATSALEWLEELV